MSEQSMFGAGIMCLQAVYLGNKHNRQNEYLVYMFGYVSDGQIEVYVKENSINFEMYSWEQ